MTSPTGPTARVPAQGYPSYTSGQGYPGYGSGHGDAPAPAYTGRADPQR